MTQHTTEQRETPYVRRTCKVRPDGQNVCGKTYTVPKGSKAKGCPECCPRLDV